MWSSSELKSFLINLAVSDVAMAVFSIPFTYTMFLLGRWIFEPWFCPVVMTMQHTSVLVSVYTLTAIGIDRYKAITNPLGRRATASRNGLVISMIWLFSFFVSSFQFRISWATSFFYDKQYYYKCQEHWDTEEESQYYTLFVFIITFFIPLLTLTYTYSAVAYKLWRTSAPGNADPARDTAQLRANIRPFGDSTFGTEIGQLNVLSLLVLAGFHLALQEEWNKEKRTEISAVGSWRWERT
ncbi:unnamed protein product [Nezara viridula]|uniref:G-protein coupled receptors family 1 profile domain-containing protein n=1 Tax=Nezara viridula TaxID=85310 RepID=A0A9P0MXG0_NEZVI|nr:unnamed protein product [Nezara viridula]